MRYTRGLQSNFLMDFDGFFAYCYANIEIPVDTVDREPRGDPVIVQAQECFREVFRGSRYLSLSLLHESSCSLRCAPSPFPAITAWFPKVLEK